MDYETWRESHSYPDDAPTRDAYERYLDNWALFILESAGQPETASAQAHRRWGLGLPDSYCEDANGDRGGHCPVVIAAIYAERVVLAAELEPIATLEEAKALALASGYAVADPSSFRTTRRGDGQCIHLVAVWGWASVSRQKTTR